MRFVLLHIALWFAAATTVAGDEDPVYADLANLRNDAVVNFSPARYRGRWFEHYSTPVPGLTDACSCNREDLMLSGVNFTNYVRCELVTRDPAPEFEAAITVMSTDNSTGTEPGAMGAIFFGTLEEHWVLDVVASENPLVPYEHALVYSHWMGAPYTWMFSRSPSPFPQDLHRRWVRHLRAKGVDTSTLLKRDHHASCNYN